MHEVDVVAALVVAGKEEIFRISGCEVAVACEHDLGAAYLCARNEALVDGVGGYEKRCLGCRQ